MGTRVGATQPKERALSGRRLKALRVEFAIPAAAVALVMAVSVSRVYAIERLQSVPRGLRLRYWTALAQIADESTSDKRA